MCTRVASIAWEQAAASPFRTMSSLARAKCTAPMAVLCPNVDRWQVVLTVAASRPETFRG